VDEEMSYCSLSAIRNLQLSFCVPGQPVSFNKAIYDPHAKAGRPEAWGLGHVPYGARSPLMTYASVQKQEFAIPHRPQTVGEVQKGLKR